MTTSNQGTDVTASTRPRPVPADDQFDPAQVPVFPVITVEVVDGTQLLVDGRTEPIPAEVSLPDAAVEAAAAAVRRRGLEHCRVAAVLDGQTYPLVVAADGSRYDTSRPSPKTRQSGTSRDRSRAWVIPVTVMILAALTAAIAVFPVHKFRSPQTAPPPAVPTPTRTELPVLPPDGWTTHAAWAAPVAAAQRTTALPAGDSVLTVSDDGAVTALTADTGAIHWQTTLPGPDPVDGPVRTTIDGEPAAAVVTSRSLAWWPLTGSGGGAASPTPLQVPLPAQAKVTFTGTSPLVVLPGQHAAVLAAGQLSERIIPAGAQAARADGAVITALDHRGRIWRLTTDAPQVPDPVAALHPPTAGLQPTLLGTAAHALVIGWRADIGDSRLAVTNLTGRTLAARTVADIGSDWHADDQIATIGGYLITLQPTRIVPITEPTWRTTRITEGTAYGTVRGDNAILNRSGRTRPATDPSAAPPIAVDSRHAYVVADTPTGPVLYALQPA